jgi:Bacterial PH domain
VKSIVAYLEFRSRVDRWLAWVLMGTCALLLAVGMVVLLDESSDAPSKVIISLTTTFAVPFLLWILFGTWYRLSENQLSVRCGPFFKKIPLDSITSIEPVRGFQSCHALSRHRFQITYGNNDWVMISPEDRARFLQEILLRAPHLVWQDKKLVAYSGSSSGGRS